MVIIKWGSSINMSADIDVTAVPSFDTQIFLCEIKLNYKQYGFNIFINNCLFNMHMFNIQHKEHVQISHVSYIRKPRLSGIFLGNECVRINEVSLYNINLNELRCSTGIGFRI